MKNNTKILILFVIAVCLSACGVATALPTATAQPTQTAKPTATVMPTPTIFRNPNADYLPPTVKYICAANVNARSEDASDVIAVLKYGDQVVYLGDVIEINGEKWRPTDRGLIDPKYIGDCGW